MIRLKIGKDECNAFMLKKKVMSKKDDMDLVTSINSGDDSMIPK